jgi:DNA-binding SARP family transcriptional activator
VPRAAAGSPPTPPHLARLLARLGAIDTPVVQLWGWPGSGQQATLEALLAEPAARALALADLGGDAAARRAVAAALDGGGRWLVLPELVEPPAPERLGRVARMLPAGVRLAFAAPARLVPGALDCSWLTPDELRLTAAETGALWQAVTGRAPGRRSLAALHRATDGWLEPLRLAATSGAVKAGGATPTAASLAAIPGVAELLRHRVWERLDARSRRYLSEAAAGGDGEGGGWDAGVRRPPPEALARLGLEVDLGDGRRRPPALLLAFAAGQRPGRGGERRSRSAAADGDAPASAAEPAGYEIRLFGHGAVRLLGSAAELRFPLKRSFKLLAYLATAPGHQASRDELIDAVWHEADAEEVERNFHPTLSLLRRSLRGGGTAAGRGAGTPRAVEHLQGVYRLDPERRWEIDAVEFERRHAAGRERLREGEEEQALALWEGAWKLWAGSFLTPFEDPWITARRDRYQRLHVDLLSGLGDLYTRRERWVEAIDSYRAALLTDPLQERLYLEVLRLYGRQGRRDLVRRTYDRLTVLLRRELGVEPLPEIRDEYHKLMA